ncbi:helix-turn-helix domain-containing protein [uncultured Halomonas sp.]|uniref:helix-turn-helix transcriptional regulator n=1 Tax=uncultured Halomonas sp. TaxID=173971 RepID=UPI00260294B8|nr:helix-turn-helix domain-containing protein [uncultured Halomonas sp.]
MTTDPVLTVTQAARWLGVSRSTLWRLHAHYGALPAPMRLSPGRVGYRRSTLENYINQLEAV